MMSLTKQQNYKTTNQAKNVFSNFSQILFNKMLKNNCKMLENWHFWRYNRIKKVNLDARKSRMWKFGREKKKLLKNKKTLIMKLERRMNWREFE